MFIIPARKLVNKRNFQTHHCFASRHTLIKQHVPVRPEMVNLGGGGENYIHTTVCCLITNVKLRGKKCRKNETNFVYVSWKILFICKLNIGVCMITTCLSTWTKKHLIPHVVGNVTDDECRHIRRCSPSWTCRIHFVWDPSSSCLLLWSVLSAAMWRHVFWWIGKTFPTKEQI